MGSTTPLHLAADCRCLAARTATPADHDPQLLASLRYLNESLQAWRRARLEAAAGGAGACPLRDATPPPLGELARGFASWLDRHPERANEPVAWQLREALAELGAGR